ncbi:ABC transporter periplasmic binding protein MlaC [Mannheimia haemolytica]|uniref:ABC transporter periplasmic binding protein MlaC n=1 Tax=Mannheimia haemolytica TaxID=75985 RepID=A0A378MW86_MANHA|nr:ABC transporter periplasmic binding protein MlaC [Mannheimia haemolytica]
MQTKQNEWAGVIRQKGIDALIAQVAQSAKQAYHFKISSLVMPQKNITMGHSAK